MASKTDFERLQRQHWQLRDDVDALLRTLQKSAPSLHAAFCTEKSEAVSPTLEEVLKKEPWTLLSQVCELCEPESCDGEEVKLGALLRMKQLSSRLRAAIEPLQGERLLAVGGADGYRGNPLYTAEWLRDQTKSKTENANSTWEPLEDIRSARALSVVAVFKGRVYVFGGHALFGKYGACFNPRARRWEYSVPAMTKQRAGAAAGVLSGRLVVCGGEDTSDGTVHSCVECLDLTLAGGRGAWFVDEALKMNAALAHCAATVIPLSGVESLVVCGGTRTSAFGPGRVSIEQTPSASAEVLVPQAGVGWRRLPNLTVPRYFHGVAAVGGIVYACGGYCQGQLKSVECYKPDEGMWQSCSPMWLARSSLNVVAMGGSLYVLGGDAEAQAFSSVETFDPKQGEWKRIANMLQGRTGLVSATVKVGILAQRGS